MKEFTAIIPAAGKGVRLLPYTAHMPKTMICVAGKPILGHILDQVESLGIKKVVFIVGYKKETILEFVQSQYPHLEASFVEQPEPKGLGHAIYLAKEKVSGPCFILLGDTIVDGDLKPLVFGGQNAIGIRTVQDPSRFGIVELKNGKIVSFEEKPARPKSNLAIIGAYSFLDSAQLFSALEEVIRSGKTVKNEIQLTDALSVLLARGVEIHPVQMNDWFDCGTVEVLLQTNRLLLDRHHRIPAGLERNNKIIPPCWIADGVQAQNCTLGPYVSIAYEARLTDCALKDAIVGPQTRLQHKTAEHAVLDKHNF